MSTTLQDYVDRYDCERDGCQNHRTPDSSVEGSYCSEECADAARGATIIHHLEHDHRFCSSCYRPHKVIWRPPDDQTPELRKKALLVRESFVGFETLTQHAETANYGVECACGAVGHRTAEDLCRNGAPYEWYLALAIHQLREEGEWDYQFDITEFADYRWEHPDADLATAVGHATT